MNELRTNMMDKVANAAPSSANTARSQTATAVASVDTRSVSAVEPSGKELPPQPVKPTVMDEERVKEAVSRINEYVQQTERTLDFQLDEDSGKTVIRVYDRQSDELIRQIPSELALELAQKLNDEEPSLLFSAQV